MTYVSSTLDSSSNTTTIFNRHDMHNIFHCRVPLTYLGDFLLLSRAIKKVPLPLIASLSSLDDLYILAPLLGLPVLLQNLLSKTKGALVFFLSSRSRMLSFVLGQMGAAQQPRPCALVPTMSDSFTDLYNFLHPDTVFADRWSLHHLRACICHVDRAEGIPHHRLGRLPNDLARKDVVLKLRWMLASGFLCSHLITVDRFFWV